MGGGGLMIDLRPYHSSPETDSTYPGPTFNFLEIRSLYTKQQSSVLR